jgi:CRP-like cAMP-binding protein
MLSELLVEEHVSNGQIIVTQGDTVDSVYFIVDGNADVRNVTIQNNTPVFESLATLGPGQSIGLSETGFYSLSGIRTATVVAETEMLLFRLSVAAFNGFALAYPHVGEVMRKNA